MTIRQIIYRIAATIAGLLCVVIAAFLAAATGNFSGQSYSSGTYCSGCAPKWSK
jgi:hypothetical protein